MPPYGRQTYTGSSGQDTVGAGTFWGVLNVSFRASGTQLGLDLTLFVTDACSQLTFEMGKGGGAGISKNVTNAGSQMTFEMGEGAGQE